MNKITAVFAAVLSIVSSQDLDWRLGQEWNEDTFDIDEDGEFSFQQNMAFNGFVVDRTADPQFWATYTIYANDPTNSYLWLNGNQTCVLRKDDKSEINFLPATNITYEMDVTDLDGAHRCDLLTLLNWTKVSVTFQSGGPEDNFTFGSNFTLEQDENPLYEIYSLGIYT